MFVLFNFSVDARDMVVLLNSNVDNFILPTRVFPKFLLHMAAFDSILKQHYYFSEPWNSCHIPVPRSDFPPFQISEHHSESEMENIFKRMNISTTKKGFNIVFLCKLTILTVIILGLTSVYFPLYLGLHEQLKGQKLREKKYLDSQQLIHSNTHSMYQLRTNLITKYTPDVGSNIRLKMSIIFSFS